MPIFHGHLSCTLRMGRDTGVEPVHVRFTAECVHRFTNRASGYKYMRVTDRKQATFDASARVRTQCADICLVLR